MMNAAKTPPPLPGLEPPANDALRWEALRRRDASADGTFVYAVRTTGVYCRPSCPSRLPRRENVTFHQNPDAAEKAGFRPCKRCQPRLQPQGWTVEREHAAKVAAACRAIDSAETEPSLGTLAGAAAMSPHHFHRVFKSITGLTPKGYAKARRAARVRRELSRDRTGSVTEALYEAGYQSTGRFYAESGGTLGMLPGRFRQGGKGERIRFAVGECSLGAILVAASERGVCAISLGGDPDALVRELQDQFPQAELAGGDAGFEEQVARVVGFVESPRLGLNLPLDVRGTAFQRRVWEALRRLPAGAKASYSEIAEAIGAPDARRAVASACAANRLAVAIPCHRVVRRDGGLSGYRWGVERKRALLQREESP